MGTDGPLWGLLKATAKITYSLQLRVLLKIKLRRTSIFQPFAPVMKALQGMMQFQPHLHFAAYFSPDVLSTAGNGVYERADIPARSRFRRKADLT